MKKAKLIHIQCGVFNGIANIQIDDKIIRLELGTPNYNDYGEYRVDTEFETIPFDEKYIGSIPTKGLTEITLTNEQANWWLTDHQSDQWKEKYELLEYMEDAQVCGGNQKEKGFVIFDKNNKVVKFEDWEKLEHDPYEHLMFNTLSIFFNWIRSDEYKSTGNGLTLFPRL